MTGTDAKSVTCPLCGAVPTKACHSSSGAWSAPHRARVESAAADAARCDGMDPSWTEGAAQLRLGSLFSGYGGLDMGVSAVTGARTVWVSDIDKGACKILAHRYPDVPNIGDITKVDWASLEDIEILTGGFPCQDVSHAGRRRGLRRGETRTGLWAEMVRAIDIKRPRLVVAENVKGLLSAEADSDMEPCPWCLGDDTSGAMRALGAVLADLADIGYDARWVGVRASDVGAAHQRFRVFIVAYPAGSESELAGLIVNGAPAMTAALGSVPRLPTPGAYDGSRGGTQSPKKRRAGGHQPSLVDVIEHMPVLPTPTASGSEGNIKRKPSSGQTLGQALGMFGDNNKARPALLPTPKASNNENRTTWDPENGNLGSALNTLAGVPAKVGPLLPTPAVNDMGEGKLPDEWDAWNDGSTMAHQRHGPSLAIETQRASTWGQYAPAIARWADVLGRPAPAPTKPGSKPGKDGITRPRLNPPFTEWLMGLPEGHICDVPDISDEQAKKACGNGVVPQAAAAATTYCLLAPSRVLA